MTDLSKKDKLAKPMSRIAQVGLALLLLYAIFKGSQGGNDINVYLHAGTQFLNGEDIYASNPYNRYLYSPLFAALMAPFSLLPWGLARILWAFLGIFLIYRCYHILRELIPSSVWESRASWIWKLGLVFMSFNSFNHNLLLGQMTVIILWMTLEGLYQVFYGKEWKGAALLALGMNIKIIPILAIAYIFFKGRIKASAMSGGFFILSLLLPALIIGWSADISLHNQWLSEINPTGDRYSLEDNTGCVSLNCMLPTYFHASAEELDPLLQIDTLIVSISPQKLVLMIQVGRILIFLGLIWIIFLHRKNPLEKEKLLKEWSILLIATLLILPHQMKYSMLYASPAIFLLWTEWLDSKNRDWRFFLQSIALAAAFICSIMGTDIIGDITVRFLDHFHFMGLTLILIFLALLSNNEDVPKNIHAKA